MKNRSKILAGMLLATALASCEKDLEVYHEDTCRLNFYYSGVSGTSSLERSLTDTHYSFVYGGKHLESDTLWLPMQTMGFVYDEPRAISLEQIDNEDALLPKAVAGKHYMALEQLSSYYVVPAGTAMASVPIVLLKDASLDEQEYLLTLRIRANEWFENGYEAFQTRRIYITNMLSEPSAWYQTYCHYYFGKYGPVKHQFLIDETGEKWDNDYINTLMEGDTGYINYLAEKMARRLAEINAERAASGQGVLTEADGTIVTIESDYEG
jgi:hypothetical protein